MYHTIWTALLVIGFNLNALLASDWPTWRLSATNEIQITDVEWRDADRDRTIPARIYSPRTNHQPAPVIIFSHGLGGSREGYAYLGQYWAAHGYVSVHLQHAGSDAAVWEDARFGQRMAAMRRAAADPRNAMNRARDVSFAIDQLTYLNATNSPWRSCFDLDRVGVAGHSFGAHTALSVAGAKYAPLGGTVSLAKDPRVKAAIPMSAPAPANRARLAAAFAGVNIPCFHLTGTKDDSPIGDTTAADRRLPFDHCNSSDQYLITFTGGDHAIFSGRDRWFGGGKDEQFQRHICLSSLAFWDAYLRDDTAAKEWLRTQFESELGAAGVFEVKPK